MWHGPSTIAVFPSYDFKRFENDLPLIKGHKGGVTDCAWSPFADQLLASSSEDATAKLWIIKEGGLKGHMMNSACDLVGH